MMSEKVEALIRASRRLGKALVEMARKLVAAFKRLLPVLRRAVLDVVRMDAEQTAYADWNGVLWPKGELGVVGHVR